MKALSLKQPWAWAIFYCGKDIENRNWATKYRGRILIHASKNYDAEGATWLMNHFGFIIPEYQDFRGYILGSVTVADCVKYSPSRWFFGPYGFVLENPVEFKKLIPWKGKLGLFEIPNDFFIDCPDK